MLASPRLSTATSTAFQTGVNAIRVLASTSCHIKLRSSPTATTSDPKLPGNVPEYLVVAVGQKLAAVRTTTSGTLHVTEVSG
jgi:hypothetical protein